LNADGVGFAPPNNAKQKTRRNALTTSNDGNPGAPVIGTRTQEVDIVLFVFVLKVVILRVIVRVSLMLVRVS
jgi:hypothetical protein